MVNKYIEYMRQCFNEIMKKKWNKELVSKLVQNLITKIESKPLDQFDGRLSRRWVSLLIGVSAGVHQSLLRRLNNQFTVWSERRPQVIGIAFLRNPNPSVELPGDPPVLILLQAMHFNVVVNGLHFDLIGSIVTAIDSDIEVHVVIGLLWGVVLLLVCHSLIHFLVIPLVIPYVFLKHISVVLITDGIHYFILILVLITFCSIKQLSKTSIGIAFTESL